VDLAICTIEKANSLMNKIIEEKVYFDISFFIIDEFHLVTFSLFLIFIDS
jgi:replicative superfamily II helicase